MPDALHSGADFNGCAPARLAIGSQPPVATPPVKRPARYAPAGHPIPLASGLRYDQLLDYIAAHPSLRILEIGVARAANTLRMLAFADWLGGRPRYTGIDLFGLLTDELFDQSYCSASKRPLSAAATMAQLTNLLGGEIAARIELLEGFSYDVLPRLIADNRQYDLIFIDGGHSYDDVSKDWRYCQQLLAPGGVIVFDDYPNWGIKPTVDQIDRAHWHVRVLPHRDTFQNHRTDDDPSPLRHHQLVEVRRRGESNGQA
jgi:predicted O-methyltransferase YrrM